MECFPGFERSLKTQKCIKKCAPHLIRNPSTGRCIRNRSAPATTATAPATAPAITTPAPARPLSLYLASSTEAPSPFQYAPPSMRDGSFTYVQTQPSNDSDFSLHGFSETSTDPNIIQYTFMEPKSKFEEYDDDDSDDSYSFSIPSSKAPSSKAPSSKAPSIKAPSSKAPSSKAPSSKAPSSKAPSSKAPSQIDSTSSGWLSSKSKTRSSKSNTRSSKSNSKSKSKSASYQSPEAVWINPTIFNSLDKNANAYGTPPTSYQEIRPHSLDAVTHDSMGTLGSSPSVRSMTSPAVSTMQLEIDNLSDQIDKLIASNTDMNGKFKQMNDAHMEIENKLGENASHIIQLDQAVRTAARPNYVLLGYNGVENGAPVPVFAKTVNQEFSTQALTALGVDTKSNTPFYFVFRQLVHMRGPAGLPINLYEINQFASFCDHNLKVLVPVRSLKPGATKFTTNEKLVHSIAQTNGRKVSYESAPSPSPSPPAAAATASSAPSPSAAAPAPSPPAAAPSPSPSAAAPAAAAATAPPAAAAAAPSETSSLATFTTPFSSMFSTESSMARGGARRRHPNPKKRTQRRIFRLFN